MWPTAYYSKILAIQSKCRQCMSINSLNITMKPRCRVGRHKWWSRPHHVPLFHSHPLNLDTSWHPGHPWSDCWLQARCWRNFCTCSSDPQALVNTRTRSIQTYYCSQTLVVDIILEHGTSVHARHTQLANIISILQHELLRNTLHASPPWPLSAAARCCVGLGCIRLARGRGCCMAAGANNRTHLVRIALE